MNKPKYRLLSQFKNRVIYTDSEVEKNSFLEKGFHIDENWQKPATPKKRKAVKTEDENIFED